MKIIIKKSDKIHRKDYYRGAFGTDSIHT